MSRDMTKKEPLGHIYCVLPQTRPIQTLRVSHPIFLIKALVLHALVEEHTHLVGVMPALGIEGIA